MNVSIMVSGLYVSLFLVIYFSYSSMDKGYDSGKEKSPNELDGFKYVHVWIQYSSLIIGLLSLNVDHPALLEFPMLPYQNLMGLGVSIVGGIIFLAAKAELGICYSPCDDQYLPPKIINTGIYRIFRHPIYLSTSVVLWGFAISTGSLWLALNAVLLSSFQYRSAKIEEKTLSSHFSEYRNYLQEKKGA